MNDPGKNRLHLHLAAWSAGLVACMLLLLALAIAPRQSASIVAEPPVAAEVVQPDAPGDLGDEVELPRLQVGNGSVEVQALAVVSRLDGIVAYREREEQGLWYFGLDQLPAEKRPTAKLVKVDLTNTAADNETLAALAGLHDIDYLCLNGTRITDAGLVHLAGLIQMDALYLDGTRVTDAGLVHLAGMKKIKLLQLPDGVSDQAVESLRRRFPSAIISK